LDSQLGPGRGLVHPFPGLVIRQCGVLNMYSPLTEGESLATAASARDAPLAQGALNRVLKKGSASPQRAVLHCERSVHLTSPLRGLVQEHRLAGPCQPSALRALCERSPKSTVWLGPASRALCEPSASARPRAPSGWALPAERSASPLRALAQEHRLAGPCQPSAQRVLLHTARALPFPRRQLVRYYSFMPYNGYCVGSITLNTTQAPTLSLGGRVGCTRCGDTGGERRGVKAAVVSC
jgi:hypothetical protein